MLYNGTSRNGLLHSGTEMSSPQAAHTKEILVYIWLSVHRKSLISTILSTGQKSPLPRLFINNYIQ